MDEKKLLSTWHNLRELERDGWRVPTIFELIKMQESGAGGEDWVWSSSTYNYNSNYAWYVNFSYGNGGNDNKYYNHYVRLVRGGQFFDHWTPVMVEEVHAFRRTGELPDWHPPLDVSMTDGTREDEQGPVAADCPNVYLPALAVDALRNAAREFVEDCGWSLDGEQGVPEPLEDTEFFRVLSKHIGPLLNVEAYRAARIAALKAELKILEDPRRLTQN